MGELLHGARRNSLQSRYRRLTRRPNMSQLPTPLNMSCRTDIYSMNSRFLDHKPQTTTLWSENQAAIATHTIWSFMHEQNTSFIFSSRSCRSRLKTGDQICTVTWIFGGHIHKGTRATLVRVYDLWAWPVARPRGVLGKECSDNSD